ncbi:MAG: DUF2721 domain-containing protein [Acidobacteria bacterium]|nr:DUF2721 domain-containing protein [Acidobacteriota bacterium]
MNPLLSLPFNFQNLSSALNVLTAMLTPALLLSACGSFIISTSGRLGRVVDRVRKLADRMEEVMESETDPEMLEERKAMIEKHMEWQSKRANLLMRTMVSLYIASGLFVLTSVSIGFVSIFSASWAVIPVALGVMGAIMMLVAAIRLITEAHLALDSLNDETQFLLRLTRKRRVKEAS